MRHTMPTYTTHDDYGDTIDVRMMLDGRYGVTLTDDDSGERLPETRIYDNLADAIAYADSIALKNNTGR